MQECKGSGSQIMGQTGEVDAGRQSLAGIQRYIQGGKQVHSRQKHSCWRRQGETGRQATKQRQASRLTDRSGKDRGSQGKIGRKRSRDRHSETGRYASNH
jgi:hypothetical protein